MGGDWYDVIPLGAGRLGIVIGDVMGCWGFRALDDGKVVWAELDLTR